MELLRNNPSLLNRDYLEVGEELIIDYDRKEQEVRVNGMTFSFISDDVLRKTLPYLTYITVVGYQVSENGSFRDVDDERIINMAIDYGVVPLMLVSSLNEYGLGSIDVTHRLFNDQELQTKLIDNVIQTMEAKGYLGAVFGFQFILEEDLSLYIDFIDYASMRLHAREYSIGVVLIPTS